MGSGAYGRKFLKEIDAIAAIRNYIENSGAARNTLGGATYADAAGAAPVDGTGGSPTVTWTRTTSSPLRGLASFLFTKDAANRQGEGEGIPFTIDAADQGKVLSIRADYAIASGTYSGGTPTTDSDLVAYIVDATNGTVIQPVGYKLDGAVIGQNYSLRASFQAASNSTSYRLCFHVATTSASAYTVKFDGLTVNAQAIGVAPIVSDDVVYTPVFTGFGTATGITFTARRVGNRLRVTGKFVAGTTTGVEARIGLPAGLLTADSTIIPSIRIFGWFGQKSSTTDRFKGGAVLATAGVGYVNISTNGIFTNDVANPLVAALGNDTGNGGTISMDFEVPIAGWGSTMGLFGQYDDGRPVTMRVNANTGTLGTSFADITTWDDNLSDTHGAFNTSTGVYTVPYPGKYRVHARVYGSTSGTSNWAGLQIIHNATAKGESYDAAGGASNAAPSTHELLDCAAGDTIKIQGIASASTAINTTTIRNTFTIERVGGASQPGALESVAAIYKISGSTANASVANGATEIIDFDTRVKDTHTAVTTGTGWRFTAPVPGNYQVDAIVGLVAMGAANPIRLMVYKNGALFSLLGQDRNPTAASDTYASGGRLVPLNAGEYIDIEVLNGDSSTRSVVTTDGHGYVSIAKVP